MSQNGHFRAHGRRKVDLSAALDRGDGPKPSEGQTGAGGAPINRPSTVPARPIRPPSGTARKRPSDPTAPRARADSSAPERSTAERVRIVNLSLAGACIEAAEPVPLGASLALEIVAPTLWDPLVLKGRVIWTRPDKGSLTRAGLSFEHDDAARAFALFELLGAHDYDA